MNYWQEEKVRLNYVGGGPRSLCSGRLVLANGSSWDIADPRSRLTQVPLWFVSMHSIVQAPRALCTADYGVTVRLHPYFCFSPLLVRQVPYLDVGFADVAVTSDIVIDFAGPVPGHAAPGFHLDNASVNRLWLVRSPGAPMPLSLTTSNVTFYFPSAARAATVFYGYAGTASEVVGQTRTLYQLEYGVAQAVRGVYRFELTAPAALQCNAGECVATAGASTSHVRFESEDGAGALTV